MHSDDNQRPTPDMLRAVGLDPGSISAVERMPGGLSGAHLWRITSTDIPASDRGGSTSYVLKCITPASGWLGAASQDTLMREVRLWEAGLLGDLPNEIATGVLHVARGEDNTGSAWGVLLMRDERAHLMRQPLRPPHGFLPGELRRLLDVLAKMHAQSWEDPRLHDAALGLTSPRAALLLASPATIASRIAQGDSTQYLTLARSGWEDFFRLAGSTAGDRLRAVFETPEPYIAAIHSLPATLVHGDVWGPNLGWVPATFTSPRQGRRLLLLDWALSTAGPATYDPLWICGTWHTLDPIRVLAYFRVRLDIYLTAHGRPLDPAVWQALADAGYLRIVLTCGEALARSATLAPPGAARRRAAARVRWWAERAARAAARLVPGG